MISKRVFFTNYSALFSIMFGYALIIPFIDTFAQKFNTSILVSGYVISAYALGQLIFSPIVGELLLIFNKRIILCICLIGYAISCGLSFLAPTFLALLILRFVSGVFAALIFPSAETYVSVSISKINPYAVTRFSVILSSACGIGMGIGPIVGVYFLLNLSIALVGVMICLIAIISSLLCFFFLEDNLPKERVRPKFKFFIFLKRVVLEIFELYKNRKSRFVLNSFLFYGIITSTLEAYGFKYLKDQRIAHNPVPYIPIIILIILALYFFFKVSHKIEKRFDYQLILSSYAFVAASSFLLIFITGNSIAFIILFIIAFVSLALFSSVAIAFVSNHFSQPERILSNKNSLICIGMVLGPILGGLFYQFKPESIFLFLAVGLFLIAGYGVFSKVMGE